MASGVIDDEEVSMVDVLHEDNELEAEANAVLGDSDDQNCTYDKGYVNRQALYACLTCIPAAPEVEPGGVCLACSLSCHDNHELVELYTKRHFRCDCGNDKFGSFECTLTKDKDPTNQLNQYNQNFKGLYCSCTRPYPDHDDEIEDDMIQCILCEDWYHSRHLQNLPPFDGEYQEMICDQCMDKHTFLHPYVQYSAPSQQICTIKKSESDADVDIENITSDKPAVTTLGTDTAATVSHDNEAGQSNQSCSTEQTPEKEKGEKRKLDKTVSAECGETSSKKKCEDTDASETTGCVHQKLLQNSSKHEGCTYWKTGWRSQLCKCKDCMGKYEELGVTFLLDTSDTIAAYEDRGQTRRDSQSSTYDSGLSALNNLGRVQQMEILHGYNDLKTELKSYLSEFAEQGKTVTEEDIKNFFQKLKNKKNTPGSGSFQHFCR